MLNFMEYVSRTRWLSFWHQITEVLECQPKSVLIIGGGDKVIEPILKEQGIDVYVFDRRTDIDAEYCGDLREIETIVTDRKFDAILCCQILEHIEFEHFERIVRFLKEISDKRVIISLPYSNITLSIWVQWIVERNKFFNIGVPRSWENHIDKYHRWEVGTKDVSAKKVREILQRYYKIIKEFKCEMNPYHLFYVLEKQ